VEFAFKAFARFLLLSVLVLRLLALVDFDSSASKFVKASFLATCRCISHGSSNNVHRVEQ